MTWALLPVKDLVLAKTRLSGVLSPSERRALAQAMVEDVLTVLVNSNGLDGVLMVSADPSAELLSHKYQIDIASERDLGCSGLNGAVDAGRGLLAQRGVTGVMVMHSDLPLLRVLDVEALLSRFASTETDVVIAPDLAGTGTNIMLMPTRPALGLHYGEGSCQAHQESACDLGMKVEIAASESAGLDVDCPVDLLHAYHQLELENRDSHCAQLLLGSDIAQRLSSMERGGIGLESPWPKNSEIL